MKVQNRALAWFKGNRLIVIGILLLVEGSILYPIGLDFVTAANACLHPRGNVFPPGSGQFYPGASFESVCLVNRDLGQNLIFFARITNWDAEEIAIPSHVKITDPSGKVLIDEDYNQGRIIIYIKPEIMGTYNATIMSLEDPENRVSRNPKIAYAFGFIAGLGTNLYQGVSNPVGIAYEVMTIVGGSSFLPGMILIAWGLAKNYRQKKLSIK